MLVKLLGIVMVVLGVIYFLKPAIYRKYIDFWTKDKSHVYGGLALAIVIGIILLRAASSCSIPWFVILIGILSLIKGIVGLVVGEQKAIAFAQSFKNKPDKKLRNMGIFAIIVGVLLIYAA